MLKLIPTVIHGPKHKWFALSTVAIGVFMATLDSGIVSVSLPTIMGFFQVDVATIQWVVLAYLLTITVTLLAFGRLADIIGRKQVYALGFVIFTAGSAMCGAATNAQQLIAFRAIQALGASMLMANGMAITSAVFPPKERGMALGINGTVVATGITIGPTIGGILTQWLGWRSIFYVNLPIGVIGTIMAFLVLREGQIMLAGAGRRPRFDLAGALIAGFGLLALMMALAGGESIGMSREGSFLLYGFAALALVAFILVERRVAEPMVDLRLFRLPLFALGSVAGLLSFLASSSNMLLLPFYLQLILGFSPSQAGLVMISSSVVIAFIAPASGWLSDRIGARLLSSLGLLMVSVSLLSLGRLDSSSGYGDVMLRLALLGLGQGLFQSPNNSSVIGAVPRERYGVASGFLSMMRNLGMVMGAALASNLLLAAVAAKAGNLNLDALRTSGAAGNPLLLSGFMSGMQQAYTVAAILAAAGIVASLSRGGSFRPSAAGVEARPSQRPAESPANAAAQPSRRAPIDGRPDGPGPAGD